MKLVFVLAGKRGSVLQKRDAFAGKRLVLRLTCTPQGSRANQTKADVVVPVVRVVVVSVDGTGVRSIVVPVPAAFNPVGASSRSPFSLKIFL